MPFTARWLRGNEKWQSGRVAEWQSGRVAEWQSGRKKQSYSLIFSKELIDTYRKEIQKKIHQKDRNKATG